MAKYPDHLVLHPIEQLVITNADDKYCLHKKKATEERTLNAIEVLEQVHSLKNQI